MARLPGIARFKPEARPVTITGAQAVGPTMRAPARDQFGKVEIEELEVGRLTVLAGSIPTTDAQSDET